ncbi:MAG: virulence protein RhuM/Fic/DOC family protein [Desulfobacterium sp.]|nr:virulence protein RhuM/Fic/DOC family protein [Desulfobacterium sp.]
MEDISNILIYQATDGNVKIDVKLDDETVWLTQEQMARLFGKDRTTITGHIGNIFKEGELVESMVCRDFRHTTQHGAITDKTQSQSVRYYNLDVIISVGYRVKSIQGTQFRIWATQRLKDYLVQGYAINRQRFEQNAAELQQALALIQKTARSPALATDMGRGLVDIMGRYTQTFLWLQQYDEGLLKTPKGQTGGKLRPPKKAMASLVELKKQLMNRGEASELFARPSRADSLKGIFGNLDQSAFGEPAYPTIEIKAAHLLYFIVKNHPFIDGNKRSGAFLFVDFLHKNDRLLNQNWQAVINETGLAALTLLWWLSLPLTRKTPLSN